MHELNRIIDLPLDDLHRLKQLEQTKLRILLAQYEDKSKEYQELGEIEGQEFDDELTRIEENIVYMQAEIEQMNKQCISLTVEKKNKIGAIKQYQMKRDKLASICCLQSSKLSELSDYNSKIEDEIRIARQEYEFYQQQVYNLDVKADNIRRYGCQIISQEIAALCQKKEELLAAIAEVDQSIRIEEQELNTMIDQEDIEELRQRIKAKQKVKEELKALSISNDQLRKQNEELNKTKSEYQWNPNLQIRNLQTKLQQQEARITAIEKENSWINKKSSECQQKIHEYRRYLRKENKDSSFRDRQQKPCNQDNSLKRKAVGPQKRSIYHSIKQELEEDRAEESFFDRIKQIYQPKHKQNQQSDGDTRTFRKIKRTSIIQFWIVVVILTAVTYYCFRSAKK